MHADQNVSLKAAEKELHYRITVHDMQHEYVVGDHLRVSQIFQNILSNGAEVLPIRRKGRGGYPGRDGRGWKNRLLSSVRIVVRV